MDKIEHCLFSFITINWAGQKLISYRTIVELVAETTTTTGLVVRAEWDQDEYPLGLGAKISNAELKALPITPDKWHGEWNYRVSPPPPTK